MKMKALNLRWMIVGSAICFQSCSLLPRESRSITEHTRLIEVDGVDIACDIYEGEQDKSDKLQDVPIVLLHGLAKTNYTWSKNVPALSKYFRLIAIDYMGLADTKRNFKDGYALDHLTNVTLKAMDKLEIEKATIMGNSLGGGIALVMAIKHPERVEKLILIDPASYPQKLPSRFKMAQLPILPEIFLNLFPAEWLINAGIKAIYYDPSRVTQERKKQYAEPIKSWSGQQAILKTIRALPPDNAAELAARFGEIDKETLVIWGDHDKVVPPEFAERLAKDIKRARLLVIPECGHMPHEEKPEIVNPALLDFLGVSGGRD